MIREEKEKAKERQGTRTDLKDNIHEIPQECLVANKNNALPTGHEGEAFDEVARSTDGLVSARSLYQASRILGSGLPDVITATKSGLISLESGSLLVGVFCNPTFLNISARVQTTLIMTYLSTKI